MTDKIDPIRPTDDEARLLAKAILHGARFGGLGVMHPDSGMPYVSRIATVSWGGVPHFLISTLSLHTKALQADPRCSILLGEPEPKGDPLTHPRMTVMGLAEQADKVALKDAWLSAIPKAKLYYHFSDFQMWRIVPQDVHLNGGFGKAFELNPNDLK